MASFNGMRAGQRRTARPPIAAAVPADRTKLIRAIHAAARSRGLDDDARRDVQVGVTGKASLTEHDEVELRQVLARLNGGRAPADRPHVGKVRALWWSLYWLGAVDSSDARAADAFVQRQTGVAALRFLDHRQAHSVIDALKGWAAREGVDWPAKPDLIGDRRAVLAAIEAKLVAAGAVALPVPQPVSTAGLDAHIRVSGRALRRALGKPA